MASSSVPPSGGGLQPYYQKFTTSGTFTLPSGYGASKPLLITMQVIGGGGGGSGSQQMTTNANIYLGRNNYFGAGAYVINAGASSAVAAARPGSSGGLAATQLYLTSNLTITVGAAGTLGTNRTFTWNTAVNNGNAWNQGAYANTTVASSTNAAVVGGDGGTTTAGSVSATGGKGGTHGYTDTVAKPWYLTSDPMWTNTNVSVTANSGMGVYGAAGNPAGTVGDAVPLLGTLAGGSTNTTPVYGSFGIGGKSSDGATTTGVEGTGGGINSVGAPGAVIITYWA